MRNLRVKRAPSTRITHLVIVIAAMAAFLATAPTAGAENVRFSFVTKPPKSFFCRTPSKSVTVRVLPAIRGRKVYLSRGVGNRWVDESFAVTNSAGLATLKFSTKCGSSWIGTKKFWYSVNARDADTGKWRFRTFKVGLTRVVSLLTSGFGTCQTLEAGTDECILAAMPNSSVFNVYTDEYTVEVWEIDPITLDYLQTLYISDGYGNSGRSLPVTESPFAFSINAFSEPFTGQVRIVLLTSSGDIVAASSVHTVSWQ